MSKKNLPLLVFTFLAIAHAVQAQDNEISYHIATDHADTKNSGTLFQNEIPGKNSYQSFVKKNEVNANSSEKYGGLYIGVKALPLKSDKGTIILSYTDESLSRDYFYGNKEIKKSSYAFNLDIGLEGGQDKGYHSEFLLGGSFGNLLVRFYAQAGYGWNFPIKNSKVSIRPVLNIAYGNLRYKLGDLINNSVYVQVNGNRFYSEAVQISAVTNPLSLIPRVDIPIKLTSKIMFKLHAGYHLTLSKGNPFIRFDGDDENEETLREREKITEENINLTINGIRIRKMPVDLDGLTFGLGFTF